MAARRGILMTVLVAAALIATLLSIALGSVALPIGHVAAALVGRGDPVEQAIVLQLRLPRAVLGLAVGAVLGMGGAALQGYLRNPLAEPGLLGASNGAALGAVTAIYWGLNWLGVLTLPVLSVAGALAALLLLAVLAGRGESALTLILGGVAVSTIAGAGISLALNLSPNPFAALEIMTWLMGSLEDRSYGHVALALPCIAAGLLLLGWDGRALDALTLGEDGARALGVELRAVRLRLLLGAAIGVGGAVAVAGAIGFVGLIVPHMVRPWTDRAPSSVLLPSALGGAALLTLADVAVRLIPTANELKLGVVTAMLGVPMFLFFLLRERRLW